MSPLGGLQPASPNASLIECQGHSLTNGVGLIDPTDRVSAKLAGFLGSAQEVNRSIGGACAGLSDALTGRTGAGGYAWVLQRVQRESRLRAPYEPASNVVVLQLGVADMFLNCTSGAAPSAQGLLCYIHGMRTIISRFRAAMVGESYYGASYVSYSTGSGTWTSTAHPAQIANQRGLGTIGSGTHYHKLTGNATQKNGSVITIPIPGDYPGSAVSPFHVGFIADPLLTSGTITSGGTGIAVKTLILDSATCCDTVVSPNSHNGLVLRFTGNDIPASGGVPRNLTLTVSNTSAAGAVNFDYWGIEAKSAPIIYVLQITKSNMSGSGFSAPLLHITNTHLSTWNTALQNLVNEFRGAGGSNSATDYYTEYVELDSVIGGFGWAGNESSITDNPLTSGATTINITGAGAAALTSPVMIEQEIVTFSANSGTQLTGVVRGTNATTAVSHANTTRLRSINQAAIENFDTDGYHWTEGSQKVVAQKIWRQSLSRHVNDVTVNSDRVGPGRIDCRVRARVTRLQLVPHNTVQPIRFDIQDYDTVLCHDPEGTAFGSTANSTFKVLSDGFYRLQATGAFQFTKAGQTGAGGGVLVNENGQRAVGFRLNGTAILGTNTVNPVGTSLFSPCMVSYTWEGELRNGNTIEVIALQSGGGFSTTTTGALADSGTTGVNVPVTSSSGFFVNDIVRVDNEHMLITAIPDGTNLTVTRAQEGWPRASHLSAAGIHSGFMFHHTGLGPAFFSMRKDQSV